MAEFTESEFRAWLDRRGAHAGTLSPWEDLPSLADVRVRLIDHLHACAHAGLTVTRLKVSRGEFLAIAAAVGPLPSPEATYSVLGVPIEISEG